MDSARVYSYLRFSDPRQAAGSSADRQIEYARRWAAERGMALDDSLSLRDEGLSAYHQRHVRNGALGVFLVAVEEGRIPAGSVLVVEGLDRLSRAEPIQAQAQLAQIINAGITVVTASDGREYNREQLKAQPMDLVYSLLVMIRAHEESDTKSKRVKAAIRRQCEGWLAGTWRGVIRQGKDPTWVELDAGGRWHLVPARVDAVRAALDMFKAGYGNARIAESLRTRGLALTPQGSYPQQIYRLVRQRALLGDREIEVDGQVYTLAGYYPAVIDATEWSELQTMMQQRERRSNVRALPGVVTGLGIAVCGYCGSAITGQNSPHRKRNAAGLMQDGHRRLQCSLQATSRGCSVTGSCSVVPVEKALLAYCGDQINLTRLVETGDAAEPLRARLARARSRVAELEQKLDRVSAALLADDGGSTPITFVRLAREIETELAGQRHEVEAVEHELATSARHNTPAAEAWTALASGVLGEDFDARLRMRQMVADTFSRLVIYHHGAPAVQGRDAPIDMLLVAKGGGTRLLRINRQSGEWIAGEQLI
jgi:DNA invertase Pin-like site-specific DNA recombinase